MSVTAQGAALSEVHRTLQERNAATVAILAVTLWRNFLSDGRVTEDESRRWVALLLPAILRARGVSQLLAQSYMTAFRRLELPGVADFVPDTPAELVGEEFIEKSLDYVGRASLEIRRQQIQEARARLATPDQLDALADEAVAATESQVRGAVTRHVVNGGRDEIRNTIVQDGLALGWQRVTDGDPCYWCAMLASRGPVYDKDSFDFSDSLFSGGGTAKTHDHCACFMEGVYSKDTKPAGRAEEFSQLWGSSTGGLSGQAAINAFRRVYEGRESPATI